jgi:hypothetical protein
MVPEPAPRRPSLRRAVAALLVIATVTAVAVGLGWVRLADMFDQVLAELLVLACVAAVVAFRNRPPRRSKRSPEGD